VQRIIGIDIGLRFTGYGIVDFIGQKELIVEGGVIKTDSSDDLHIRLGSIFEDLNQIYKKFNPQITSIEDLHSRYRNLKTAIIMGHARGVACAVSSLNNTPVFHYQATQIKKMITGSGRADKMQMMKSMGLRLNKGVINNEHVADAFAAAICHKMMSESPQ
tara:strand:- start:634 stop:1116 length:483 start_codon:yes stop_codon:yes gene_type:complete